MVDECLLHGVQGAVGGEALDGGDFGAGDRGGEGDAGGVQFAVDQDGAGAADAYAAAFLGAGEAEVVAEEVEEQPRGGDFGLVFRAVDFQLDHSNIIAARRRGGNCGGRESGDVVYWRRAILRQAQDEIDGKAQDESD